MIVTDCNKVSNSDRNKYMNESMKTRKLFLQQNAI